MIRTIQAQLDYSRDEAVKDPGNPILELRVRVLERQLMRAITDDMLQKIRETDSDLGS
jgi:hypothetical protein